MKCPRCQVENKAGRKFCAVCGQGLPLPCPQCGFINEPGDQFCGGCGQALSTSPPLRQPPTPRVKSPPGDQAVRRSGGKGRERRTSESGLQPLATGPIHYTPPHLAERILAEQAAIEARGATDGERKTITALFADIKGSMELLQTLPDTPERTQQELSLQLALSIPLRVTKGFAVPEVERVYTRARELCQQVGETPQLFPVLWGLWELYFVQAEYRTAHELGEQLLTLAQRQQDSTLLLQGHHAEWSILLFLGELAAVREHTAQGSALYRLQEHRSHAFPYGGHDPGVCCLTIEALALWFLGYPDQAFKKNFDALTLAQELSHPFSLAFALGFAAMLHQVRRDGQASQERAEAALTLATEHGFVSLLSAGTIMRGWALAEQGQIDEGLAQMREGLAARRTTRAELAGSYFLALLAEMYGKAGRAEEGLAMLAEALAVVDKTGERYYEAELYRLAGELSLRIGESETGRTGDSGRRTGEPERGRSGEEEKVPPLSPIPRFPDSLSHSPFPRFFPGEILPAGH